MTHPTPNRSETVEVAYNATFARVGGGLSYVINQLRALADVPGLALTVFAGPASGDQLRTVCSEIGARYEHTAFPNTAVRFAWEQTVLPFKVRNHDVLLCPGNFCPLVHRTPTLLILQTSALVGDGRAHGAGTGKKLRVLLSHRSMRRAERLVVISEPLATQVRSEPGLSGLDPVVLHSGVPSVAKGTAETRAADLEVARSIVGFHPFVLSVAHDYSHKRLDDLGRLAAHLGAPSLPTRGRGPTVVDALRIAVVGEVSDDRRAEILRQAGPGAERVEFTGVVSDTEVVRSLYAAATVAVTTSALEAWNFGIHEATSQGTPLVATDLPIHRELAGDHARYYPVGDVDALARAVVEAAESERPDPWVPDWTWERHGSYLAKMLFDLAASGGRR